MASDFNPVRRPHSTGNKIVFALKVTVISVVASVLVTTAVTSFFASTRDLVMALSIAVVVPIFVAFPVSFYVHRQRELIQTLNLELEAANSNLRAANAVNERRASTDELTGLASRRHFLERARQLINGRNDGAIVMIDADHFKRINDTFGHSSGDSALRQIATTIADCVRSEDIVGRIGGEEFAVCLPDAKADLALSIAERIRKTIARVTFRPDGKTLHPLSVSLGVAKSDAGLELDSVMRHADEALYVSKEGGRNRTTVWHPNMRDEAA